MTGTTSFDRWLDPDQQRSWRGLIMGMTMLRDRLDASLRQAHGLSLGEYEILVRLSERPGRQMRMAALADALGHSRSRTTHTIARMEHADLVIRSESPDDGRGILAVMTDHGQDILIAAAPRHVEDVRDNLVDLVSPEDFAALGRVMNTVADRLVQGHPDSEIR